MCYHQRFVIDLHINKISDLTPGLGRCERHFSQIQDLKVVQLLLRSS